MVSAGRNCSKTDANLADQGGSLLHLGQQRGENQQGGKQHEHSRIGRRFGRIDHVVLHGQENCFAEFMKVMAHALTGKSSAFPGLAATSLCESWYSGMYQRERLNALEDRRFHALMRASALTPGEAGILTSQVTPDFESFRFTVSRTDFDIPLKGGERENGRLLENRRTRAITNRGRGTEGG